VENLTLKDLIDLGSSGFLTFAVVMLWRRLGEITDRLFQYLEDARAERHEIARASGVSTQNLEAARREALETRKTP
jgi:hypothetical protein